MKFDMSDMSANVYHQNDKGVYYVKVNFPKLGLYINSWTVRTSTRNPGGELWVQPPAMFLGRRWIKVLEFRNDSQLLDLVKDEILRAVDQYEREKEVPDDELPGLEELNNIFPG